ncbi:HNH endonuclease family protein (plasmid) [Prescottella equi]|uniref:Putative endonuclease n=1 Tax=Rhodococcus hoagii TaxID=43767 RepID=A0A1Z1UXC1_RHOHA|nr:HNH endonuclease family protein [Prescottella equi]ARX60094.1 putative endonuclease [Prescottella equi]WQB72165.1 HNH endonuclease family protein [Prescottella equi]
MSVFKRGTLIAAVAALVPLGVVVANETTSNGPSSAPVPAASSASLGDPATAAPDVEELIAQLTVVDELPKVPGYERDCTKDKACVYEPAWTDNYVGRDSRNGCDTRNDVLGQQLVNVTFKPGTRDCKVTGGLLHDPYTGKNIDFDPTKPSAIQIDHVFPLARSWRAGAANWSIEQRTAFANDTERNLLAVDGPANQAKSDKGLDTWMPTNTDYHCDYARTYLNVAATYHLAVTRGDVESARSACALGQ